MPKDKKKEKKVKSGASEGQTSKVPMPPWTRIAKGGYNTKADQRDVDVAMIEKKLADRMEAKAAKDYGTADKIAAELQSMDIAYLDSSREWYTKVPPEGDAGKRKRDTEPLPEAAVEDAGEDDAPTSSDDDSEDDREDEAFIARMKAKVEAEGLSAAKSTAGSKKKQKK